MQRPSWTATKSWRTRFPPRRSAPRPCSASASWPRVPYRAGTAPKTSPAPIVIASEKSSTVRSSPTSPNDGSPSGTIGHQPRDPPAGDQHAHRPADQRQHHALGQELADQSPAPGAECRAERHLPPAGGGAGELEVGDVGAGDEQDQRDEPQQDQQRRPDLADQRVAERLETDPEPGVARGELGGELRRDADRSADASSAVTPGRIRPTAQNAGPSRVSQAGLGAEVTGSHTSVGPNGSWYSAPSTPITCCGSAVQHQGPADQAGVGAEARGPGRVGQDRHPGRRSHRRLLVGEDPAQLRPGRRGGGRRWR